MRKPFRIPPAESGDAASNTFEAEAKQEQQHIRNITYEELTFANRYSVRSIFQSSNVALSNHDIAQRFESGDKTATFLASLYLRESDRQDQNLLQIIWIVELLNVPHDDTMPLIVQNRDNNKIDNKSHFHKKPKNYNWETKIRTFKELIPLLKTPNQ